MNFTRNTMVIEKIKPRFGTSILLFFLLMNYFEQIFIYSASWQYLSTWCYCDNQPKVNGTTNSLAHSHFEEGPNIPFILAEKIFFNLLFLFSHVRSLHFSWSVCRKNGWLMHTQKSSLKILGFLFEAFVNVYIFIYEEDKYTVTWLFMFIRTNAEQLLLQIQYFICDFSGKKLLIQSDTKIYSIFNHIMHSFSSFLLLLSFTTYMLQVLTHILYHLSK